MTSAAKTLSIRLEAVGGDTVSSQFQKLGTEGNTAFNKISTVITPANDNLKVIDNTAKAFNNTLKQVATLAGAYLGIRGITNVFSGIVTANKEFEGLNASLKTVTGSSEAASDAFDMIENFATTTPYQLGEVVDAFIRLKALGLDPSEEALQSYGNSAAAFGKNILDFTSAVASATVGEFERLKTFGIKASAQGEEVSFTFQGVTTTIGKNATEIESYLRSIGEVQFAGAMSEQMKTMSGISSNIEDNFSKLARNIGSAGLNDAIKDMLTNFNDLLESSSDVATIIGEGLASAVSSASTAFMFLIDNLEIISVFIASRMAVPALTTAFALLKAGVYALNTSLLGTGVAGVSATAGIKLMWSVSKLAAVQMYATTVAANVLKGALTLLGGPAGVVLTLMYGLYKLVDSHDIAKKAASDHSDTLEKLKQQMAETTKEASNLSSEQSKNQAIAEWSNKLNIATQNVKDLEKELKQTGGVSFFNRWAPDFLLSEYEVYAKDFAEILRDSKYNLDEYEKEIWRFAADFPDFTPYARSIQEKLLLLKAAKIDAQTARDELSYIENPELRPQTIEAPEIEQPEAIVPSIDTKTYEKNIEDIRQKVLELQDPYTQAMTKATEWRENALANLDATKDGYDDFKADVEAVYDDLTQKATKTALESSTYWKDGLTLGLQDIYNETTNMAQSTQDLVKNSFSSMEDTLVEFVMTGSASFSDLITSIISDMMRMALQYAVIQPLMNSFMTYMGIPTAHTGGVIGVDSLSSKTVSPSVFANAPRFHTGGLVGGEIPIIAQAGEAVFTRGQMDALGSELNSKTPVYVNVNIINNASSTTSATTSQSQDSSGNLTIDVMIEQIESTMNRNISKGEGLAPLLEQRYGLNPAVGSYR